MRQDRKYLLLLLLVSGFFAAQLLRHDFTRLYCTYGLLLIGLNALLMMFLFCFSIVAFVDLCSDRPEEVKRAWRGWLVIFGLIFTVGLLVLLVDHAYARGLPTGSFAKTFSPKLWAKSHDVPGDLTDRQKMLGDVISNVVKTGAQDGIVRQLGQSDKNLHFPKSNCDLIYLLGPTTSQFISFGGTEWLLIWFKANDGPPRFEIRIWDVD